MALAGSIRRGFGKGLSAAGTVADSGDHAGEDAGDDDEGRITNENLRATIRKSKEVLAMHRNLLEQVCSPCSVSGIKCVHIFYALDFRYLVGCLAAISESRRTSSMNLAYCCHHCMGCEQGRSHVVALGSADPDDFWSNK
jgi:hypothetical protein